MILWMCSIKLIKIIKVIIDIWILGYITLDDLRELAAECNDNLKDNDLEKIIQTCDPSGNGTIREKPFVKYMKSL